MTESLRDKVAELLEELIPPANVVDFDDVARRVIEKVREHDAARK